MPNKKMPDSITVYSYPQFVFSWPIIVFGIILAGLQHMDWISPNAAAWTYIVITCVVMLTMGIDLSRNASIFCLVLFVAAWLGILWLQDAKHVMFFSKVGQYIAALDLSISSQAMVTTSCILACIYIAMIFLAFLNDRWRITHNEIEHSTFGHKEDATGRGAKRVLAVYPDILELLICLAGTIEVYSATGTQKLVTIKNIPFLPFRMKKISRILESSAVNEYTAEEEETPMG